MHLSFMSRFPRRPTVWTIALGSLGLAVLAAGQATSWSEDAPGKARVALMEDADLADEAEIEDDDEPAGSVRIQAEDDEEDEDSGKLSIRGDEPEAAAGSVRIQGAAPALAPAESAALVRIRKAAPAPAPAGIVHIKDSAAAKPAAFRSTASEPRNVVAPKPVQASRVNPTARRYPFEPVVTSARPAVTPPRAVQAAAPAAIASANSASAVAAFPAGVRPVQHQSSRRNPFLDDEDMDESDDEVDNAPVMYEGEDQSVALAEGDAVRTTADCPDVTDADVQAFSSVVDETTKRRPIRTLKADMQMRLSKEHSSLMDDHDRATVRERGRCAAEHDRMVVRQYYRQKYGPGYDRSTGGWSDESLAPEFPFCYHPLYFEDPNLERCGYSQGCCLQPWVSGFQFYGNVALLPIKMLLLPPCSYVYPQGDCEPCTRYSCIDNFLGPCPEGLFRSPCYSNRSCR